MQQTQKQHKKTTKPFAIHVAFENKRFFVTNASNFNISLSVAFFFSFVWLEYK